MDRQGNLYRSARYRGSYGEGIIFKMHHTKNGWTEKVLYAVTDNQGGVQPTSNLIFELAVLFTAPSNTAAFSCLALRNTRVAAGYMN